MRITDLELTIRPHGVAAAAEARLRQPGSQADTVLAADAPLALAPPSLLPLALDPTAYGQALTAQFFGDPRLRDAWRSARALADGAAAPLRVRLRLPQGAAELHALRWETLRDPLTNLPLASDARLRLVRELDSADTRPVTLGPRPDLRALLVVASPRDLGGYGFTEIDVEGEVGRVRRALGAIPLTIVGDYEGAVSRQATLGAVRKALRAGPAILCLICHGAHADDGTTLWLEDDDGRTAHVPGSAFAELLAQLDRPPLLAALIACEGGGASYHAGALAALGPRLALAGVGAVLAMQAKLSMGAARAFLPALFGELVTDGAIDRAVSVGRAALRDGGEWWVPALWLRLRDGRLWAEESPAPPTLPDSISIGGGVGTVQVVNVTGGSVGSIIGSQTNDGAPPAASGKDGAIATQRSRFDQHRAILAYYLDQLAITGAANARPEDTAGIREARAGIARAKAALVALGEAVEDLPDDTP